MGGQKYKNKNINKIIIGAFIICVFIFIFLIFLLVSNSINNQSQEINLEYGSIETVKDVIEYYKSKYISEEYSEEKKFYLDIYLELSKMPYTKDDVSNEKYYNDLLEDVAKIINYKNFRMFDKKNSINIEVICRNNEIQTIIINGIEDYFIYMDSQISLKEYEEIPNTYFNITSDILNECINNNWKNNIDFGLKESTFEQYNIFLDEGMYVRNIQSEVFNIVFTEKYNKTVIDDIYPGMDIETIESKLGDPTFSNEELEIIGYKNDKIYVFFNNNNISVYRVIEDNYQINDFLELFDKYLSGNNDELLEFMNNLTYMWPDYSDYKYSSDYFFIAYPLKGIEIKVNYDDANGILVYNNIKGSINTIKPYLKNTDFVAKLKLDSVFEYEKRRVARLLEIRKNCDDFMESIKDNNIGESLLYTFYAELDDYGGIYCIKFISRTGDNPDRELYDAVDSFLWISNNEFLYSKSGKGIFIYNLEDDRVTRVIEGNEKFKIDSFEDGIITYDGDKTTVIR